MKNSWAIGCQKKVTFYESNNKQKTLVRDSVCSDIYVPSMTGSQWVSSRNCISNINVIVAFYKYCSFVFHFVSVCRYKLCSIFFTGK